MKNLKINGLKRIEACWNVVPFIDTFSVDN